MYNKYFYDLTFTDSMDSYFIVSITISINSLMIIHFILLYMQMRTRTFSCPLKLRKKHKIICLDI